MNQGNYAGAGEVPTVRLHGVRFHALRQRECISLAMKGIAIGRGGWVVTANLDHLRRLTRNDEYARLCRDADLMVADGMPLVWASHLQGTPLPERVAGSDLISSLSMAAAGNGCSVYLLGGDPGTAQAAASTLEREYPGLVVAGSNSLDGVFENTSEQLDEVSRLLAEADPDIVYVALGSPKQEKLIASLRHRFPNMWWMGVGISFSFLCGEVRRAPLWMQQAGLEWAHRLLQEPRRLAKRYLLDGIPFALQLLSGAFVNRLAASNRQRSHRPTVRVGDHSEKSKRETLPVPDSRSKASGSE